MDLSTENINSLVISPLRFSKSNGRSCAQLLEDDFHDARPDYNPRRTRLRDQQA